MTDGFMDLGLYDVAKSETHQLLSQSSHRQGLVVMVVELGVESNSLRMERKEKRQGKGTNKLPLPDMASFSYRRTEDIAQPY